MQFQTLIIASRYIYGSLKQDRPFNEPFDQRFRLISGDIGYDLGFATLTSVSSYQTISSAYQIDYSATYVPLFALLDLGNFSGVANHNTEITKKFTQEVRLASRETGRLTWLVGGYYTHERSNNDQQLLALNPNGSIASVDLFTFSEPSIYRELAGFADATVKITSTLDISGGIRYAHIDQTTTQNGGGILGSSSPRRSDKDNVETYLANVRYKISNNATAYFRYATGYRPGGPNLIANDPATGQPFAADTFKNDSLQSYELGLRGQTADRTFSADLSGYYINWDNIQILATRNGFGVVANAAGGATIKGAEATLTARPTRGFTLTGAFAYQDARLNDADADLGASRHERLPNVPRFTASLNGEYQLMQTGLRPTIGSTLRFISDRKASFDESTSVPQYNLPSYVRVDLRTSVTIQHVQVQVYAHNIFDVRSQLISPTFGSVAGGPIQVTILQPRTIGVNLSTHF